MRASSPKVGEGLGEMCETVGQDFVFTLDIPKSPSKSKHLYSLASSHIAVSTTGGIFTRRTKGIDKTKKRRFTHIMLVILC